MDDPNFFDTATVTFIITDVNDNAPEFEPPEISATLPEDIAIGESVATFTAVDKDSGENGDFE